MEKKEMFEKLSRLDPKLIKTLTKEYTRNGQKKQFSVKYITARTVMNMLDSIVGPENWRAEYKPLSDTVMACTLFLRIDGEWIGKTDVGTPSDIEPEKGAVSDAFKRAAVHWGIGRELYNEGTANFDDDDPAPAATPEPPAASSPEGTDGGHGSDNDLGEVVWTRERQPIDKMVDWAQNDVWRKPDGKVEPISHIRNRIAVALKLPETPNGSGDKLYTLVREHFQGSKEDAIKLIKTYQPATKTA